MLQDIGVSKELLLEVETQFPKFEPSGRVMRNDPPVEICEPDFSNPALQALMREKGL